MATLPSLSRNQGFTLVELSIVLVIIGLLAGGVMAGSYLVKAAGSRAVTKEVAEFTTAMNLFNEKYAEFPGDLSNATALWPNDNTADGDGDGSINFVEGYRAWQQLSLAEMIPGRYNGTSTSPVSRNDIGQYGLEYADSVIQASSQPQAPTQPTQKKSKILGFSKTTITPTTKQPANVGKIDPNSWAYGMQGNSFLFYQKGYTAKSKTYMGGMEATEAMNIDKAIDDGFPTTGNVRLLNNNSGCVTTTTTPPSYNLSLSTPVCSLIFKFAD